MKQGSLAGNKVHKQFVVALPPTVKFTQPKFCLGFIPRSFSELYVRSLQEQRIIRPSEGDSEEKEEIIPRKTESAPATQNILRTLSVQEERTDFR